MAKLFSSTSYTGNEDGAGDIGSASNLNSEVVNDENNEDIILELGLTSESKGASKIIADINAGVYTGLDFANTQEYEFATRGLIDAPETLELLDKKGNIIWSQKAFEFVHDHKKLPTPQIPVFGKTQETITLTDCLK